MLSLQSLELVHQRVVFGIADLGPVEHVIQVFVTAQFGPQCIHFTGALGLHEYSIIMIGASGLTSLQRTTIIYNPFAGGLKGRRRQRLEQAHHLLAAAGYQVTLLPTTGPATAGDIARSSIAAGAGL